MVHSSRSNTDKRVVRTKNAIRSALFDMMETRDITSITITELTNRANINRRTFYTHYSNITDILDETESEIIASVASVVSHFDSGSLVDSTYTLFIELNRLVTEQYGFYFNLMKSDIRGILAARMKNLMKSSADKILGHFSITSEERYVMLMSSFINGGLVNVFLEWSKCGKNVSIETAAKVASIMVEYCVNNIDEITDKLNNTVFRERHRI